MTDPNRPLWQWSACELAEAITARKVTAAEVVGAAVARMRATNGKMNAVVNLHADWTIDDAAVIGKIDWTPYRGKHLKAQVETTFVRGKVV